MVNVSPHMVISLVEVIIEGLEGIINMESVTTASWGQFAFGVTDIVNSTDDVRLLLKIYVGLIPPFELL